MDIEGEGERERQRQAKYREEKIMTEPGQLSNALRITNINDFLAPTNSCVLPLDGGAIPTPVTNAPAGSVLAPIIPTDSASTSSSTTTSSVAKVTVSDCLTCSGCVTSAETVLLSTASLEKLQAHVQAQQTKVNGNEQAQAQTKAMTSVALVSRQTMASIAARYNVTMHCAAGRIVTFLRTRLHFDAVYDGFCFTQFSVVHTTRQFLKRFDDITLDDNKSNSRHEKTTTHKNENGHAVDDNSSTKTQNRTNSWRPFLTSACPGWLTYAEKTQPDNVLACLSSTPSTQASFAKLVHSIHAEKPPTSHQQHQHDKTNGKNHPSSRITWTLSIAPCHDRKIEAVRPEFQAYGPDCVITSSELDTLMNDPQYSFSFAEAAETSLDSITFDDDLFLFPRQRQGQQKQGEEIRVATTTAESTSDGYAAHAARTMAQVMLGASEKDTYDMVKFEKVSKSGDVTVATIRVPQAQPHEREHDGQRKLLLSKALSRANAKGSLEDELEHDHDQSVRFKTMKFATAYGFRSMQSILRKIKQGTCEYDFVELMACPGGCTNGGGQLPPRSAGDGYDRTESKKLLNEVNERFFTNLVEKEPPSSSRSPSQYSTTTAAAGVQYQEQRQQEATVTLSSEDPPMLNITARKVNPESTTTMPTPASLDW